MQRLRPEFLLPALALAAACVAVFLGWGYWRERRYRRRFFKIWGEASESPVLPTFSSYVRRHLKGQLLAGLAVALAVTLRALLEPWLKGAMPFSFFLAAAILTALMTDTKETLLAVLLGLLAGAWFFCEPFGSLAVAQTDDRLNAALYLFVSQGILWFVYAERNAWRRTMKSDMEAFQERKRLDQERAAREEDRALRQILLGIVECAPDPTIGFNAQGRITAWSTAAEKLLGFGGTQTVGRPLGELFPTERQADAERILTRVRSGEGVASWPTALRCKDNASLETALYLCSVKDGSGRVVGGFCVARRQLDRVD